MIGMHDLSGSTINLTHELHMTAFVDVLIYIVSSFVICQLGLMNNPSLFLNSSNILFMIGDLRNISVIRNIRHKYEILGRILTQ